MRFWILADDPLHQEVQFVLHLAVIDPGPHDTHYVEPGHATIVNTIPVPDLPVISKRKKNVGMQSAFATQKSLGSHPRNRVRMKIDLDRLADNGRIASEMVLPQVVAKNGFGRARALIGLGAYEAAAQNRPHAQHLKIIR